jgi:hypothetical protein
MSSRNWKSRQLHDERRIAPRHEFRWPGSIVDGEGAVIAPCKLVDVSATGAKLILREPQEVPDTFWLVLSSKGEVRRQCILVWRSEKALGVRFGKPASDDDKPISFIV